MITQIQFNDIPDIIINENTCKQYYSDNNTFWRGTEAQNVEQYYYRYTEDSDDAFYIKSVKDELTEEEVLEIYKQDSKFYKSFDTLDEMINESIQCRSYITPNMRSGWYYFNNIKTYFIHDNGGRPFKAVIYFDKKNIKVYKFDQDEVDDNSEDHEIVYDILVYETDFINVFVGSSNELYEPDINEDKGNSILVETSELNYTYIGESIYSFTSIQPIEQYFSPIGNNDVPYPYAIDIHKNIYLMIEDIIMIPHKNTFEYIMKEKLMPYCLCYGHQEYDTNFKYSTIKFDRTILVSRIW